MLQPAKKHIRFLTEEERNFRAAPWKQEEFRALLCSHNPKLKEGGRPSWGNLCFELKQKASDTHNMLMDQNGRWEPDG